MKFCPECKELLRSKALTDSDQHIYSKWKYCEVCGWDQRIDLSQPQINELITENDNGK